MRFHSYLSSKNERRSCRNSESRNRCSKLPRKFELSLQISKLRGHAWHRLTVIRAECSITKDYRTRLNSIDRILTYRVSTFSGVLTTAVTWWPLSNACFTNSFPVSPVPPKTTSFNGLETLFSAAILYLFWCDEPGTEKLQSHSQALFVLWQK